MIRIFEKKKTKKGYLISSTLHKQKKNLTIQIISPPKSKKINNQPANDRSARQIVAELVLQHFGLVSPHQIGIFRQFVVCHVITDVGAGERRLLGERGCVEHARRNGKADTKNKRVSGKSAQLRVAHKQRAVEEREAKKREKTDEQMRIGPRLARTAQRLGQPLVGWILEK